MLFRGALLVLALASAAPASAAAGPFGCITALAGDRKLGAAERVLEQVAIGVLRRHQVMGYELETSPFVDLGLAEPDDRELRRRLTAAFGDHRAWWNLHGLTAAPGTLAPVPGNTAFADLVRALLAEADRFGAERPPTVRPESLGTFGDATDVVVWDDAETGDPLFVEETHSVQLLPADPPEKFRVTILALPGAFEVPVVLANYKLGDTDALVVVRDGAGTIVGVAPFLPGYQTFAAQAAARAVEERAIARGGQGILAKMRAARERSALQHATVRDRLRDKVVADLHRRYPTVAPEELAGDRPVRSGSQMLPLLPVVFGPAFLLLPFSLPIVVGHPPPLSKEVGQILAYGYAWHVMLPLSSGRYLMFSYEVARRIGIFAPWSVWARLRKLEADARHKAAERDLTNLLAQEHVLHQWWQRQRARLAEPMGDVVRGLGHWFPTQPILLEYWSRENEAMTAPEANGIRLLFRRLETLDATPEFLQGVVRLLEDFGADYWGGLVATNAVVEPIEEMQYGAPLRFRDAFAVGR